MQKNASQAAVHSVHVEDWNQAGDAVVGEKRVSVPSTMAHEGEDMSQRGLGPRLENWASENFRVPPKRGDPESLETWRKYSLALNATRRFRYTADIAKRRELAEVLKVRHPFLPVSQSIFFLVKWLHNPQFLFLN